VSVAGIQDVVDIACGNLREGFEDTLIVLAIAPYNCPTRYRLLRNCQSQACFMQRSRLLNWMILGLSAALWFLWPATK
jgi:hypothetical protein